MHPESVLLFLTYRCNLRCDFCLSFNGYWRPDPAIPIESALSPRVFLHPARGQREMTAEEIAGRVLPQLLKAGVTTLALSGGEVLARRDAAAIFRAIGRSGLTWCFDSNLMLMTEALAQTAVREGCETVFVSIDGPADTHNILRGSASGFGKTLRGVERLLAARAQSGLSHPKIVVNCVIQPGNEGVAEEMVRLSSRIGADRLTFQLLSACRYEQAFDSARAVRAFTAAKRAAGELGFPIEFYPLKDPDEAELRDWFARVPARDFFSACDYVNASLRIDPEGYVIPCLEHRMGNILQEDLSAIWTGKPYTFFRNLLTNGGPFRACLRCCNMTQHSHSRNSTPADS